MEVYTGNMRPLQLQNTVHFGFVVKNRAVNSSAQTIVNKADGLESRYSNNISHYLLVNAYTKYGSSSSRVYCVLPNPQIGIL